MARRKGKRGGAPSAPSTPTLPEEGAIVDVARADRDRRWATRVEWTQGRQVCVVAPLRDDGEPYPLDAGTPLVLSWPTDTGFLEGTGRLEALGEDNVVTWVLGIVKVARQQRRAAYRLDLSVPVEVCPDGSSAPVEARTLDLSEGGLRITHPKRSAPEVGQTLHVEFDLPESESGVATVLARATAVRVKETTGADVEVGLRFAVIDAATSEAIRRFIFEEQLRRRSRGA